jgi:hypothetical protein
MKREKYAHFTFLLACWGELQYCTGTVCVCERERERDLLGTVVASRGDLFRFASTIKYKNYNICTVCPEKNKGGVMGRVPPPPSERESEGVPQRVATISGI